MRKGTLRHKHSNHCRVEGYSVECYVRIGFVYDGLIVVAGPKGMDVNAFILGQAARPQEGRVGPPDLNTSGVIRLLEIQPPTGWFSGTRSNAASCSNDLDGIADTHIVISEVLPATGAEVSSMRMNAESVSVQVGKPTKRAFHAACLVAEY